MFANPRVPWCGRRLGKTRNAIDDPPLNNRARQTGWPVLTAIALVVACGGQGRDAGAESPEQAEGLELVAGTALEQRAILLVPRDGGVAEFRSMVQPAESVSSGRTALPASVEAHSLGRFVVLREPDGTVHRYDPQRDVLTRQGRVEAAARWSGDRSRGLYFDPQTGAILLISEAGLHAFEAGESIQWAAPLDAESVLALTASSGGSSLRVLRPDGAGTPAVEARVSLPGLIMAWGRQGVFSAPNDGLQLIDLTSREPAATIELPAPVSAFVASPSAHRLYAAAGDDGRLFAVNHYTGERTAMGRVEARVEEVRSSLFGSFLLLRTGEASWFVSVVDGQREALESTWRADLPLGLPGGRVLIQQGDSVWLWNASHGSRVPPLGSSATWWLPVQWRAPEGALARRTPAVTAISGEVTSDSETVETAGAVPSEIGADEEPPRAPPAAGDAAEDEVPPGFYAVVGSSLSPGGIRSLAASLADAGYDTQVQRYRDEASETWYRALIGPYTTRDAAEEAGRRLRAERGLQAWVQEVEAAVLRSQE